MEKAAGESPVILLVEDNETHAELAMKGLQDQRPEPVVYHVSDGQLALDFLLHQGRYMDKSSSPRPDLVLLDLRIPKVDGLDVLKTIKQTPSLLQIPVIILTSSDTRNDIASSYDNHANGFVVKPLDTRKFVKMIQDLCSYWLGWNMTSRGV